MAAVVVVVVVVVVAAAAVVIVVVGVAIQVVTEFMSEVILAGGVDNSELEIETST